MQCHELDKYYTREHVVVQCMQSLDLSRYDLVIEPSAGAGAFVRHLQHDNVIAFDIAPEGRDILQQDWLCYRIEPRYTSVLIVGNPPFGINHNLSDAFIGHALSFPNVATIAFVLPNTYKKHTRQRILPKAWRIKEIIDLGKDAFIFAGNVYHMPCSFFIFDKSEGVDLRINPAQYTEAIDFYFSTPDYYDLFIFGAAPHRVITTPTHNNRGYYLKSKIALDLLYNRLVNTKWRGNSCANGGVAWFTKPEIVMQYDNSILDNSLAISSSVAPQYQ